MKEIDESHFTFRNVELFGGKSSSMNGTSLVEIENFRGVIREEKMEKTKARK